jgi:hypothetical protein
MGGTAVGAGALWTVLGDLRNGVAPASDPGLTPQSLAGLPAEDVADRIARAVTPTEGPLDADAAREAMTMALTELARRNPQADLAALPAEDVEQVVELYVANDICKRVELDVGKSVMVKAPNPVTAVRRLEEMHRFIEQCVSAAFRRQRAGAPALTRKAVTALTFRVIRDTFEVFEGYLR